jgi:hypothetical protein
MDLPWYMHLQFRLHGQHNKKYKQFPNIIKFTPIAFMGLRRFNLSGSFTSKTVKKTALFLLCLLFIPLYSQTGQSLKEVKKEANKLFENEEFTEAYPFYSQLVANYPKDPEYNYRLGVCMIYSEPDKKKCIPFLKLAAANPKEAPKDVNFYLGKAFHINYRFDEALKYYNAFKETASASQQKKMQVDLEIAACNHGKHLLSNLTDLVVQNKKELNEADYFRSYDLKNMGGKLLVKPEDFQTPVDKKKKERSVMFLPKGGSVVYFSSYGETGENGKDIYSAERLPGGAFGKPVKVPVINTPYDEDYPFVHPNGTTLYFASKGHNSMGGYDIFKSNYIESTNSWSSPVNLEFPINSPDDDYLFVTDSLESTAFFSTGRQSRPGKIDVLKIKTERKPIDQLVIKGATASSEEQPLRSQITVKDLSTSQIIGEFNSADDGSYEMTLPNGANLEFTVETPGFTRQSENVSLPFATSSKPYRQTIGYSEGKLTIINYFDEAASDDNYRQYLALIEKKAKLEVNEGENKLTVPTVVAEVAEEPLKNDTALVINNTVRPTVIEEEGPGTTSQKSVDNNQLAAMARGDANELHQEARQLTQDAMDAESLGNRQREDAGKKLASAQEALKAADNLGEGDDKKTAIQKAHELQQTAEMETAIADKIDLLAASLKTDAANREKEAVLNDQYAQELERSLSGKNSNESLARLEAIEGEIAQLSGRKATSDNLITLLKTDIDQKEKDLAGAEQAMADSRTALEEIKAEISDKENELANTKKKSKKEAINSELAVLKSSAEEKETEVRQRESETARVNNELLMLRSELEVTNEIKTSDIAVREPVKEELPVASNNGTANTAPAENNNPGGPVTNAALKEKYADVLKPSDPGNKGALEENILQLNSYNGEIDKAITDNRSALAKTTGETARKKITAEIARLEDTKKQNLGEIASNKKQLNTLAAVAVEKPAGNNNEAYAPIVASSPGEAIAGFEKLSAGLAASTSNFKFSAYSNPEAQALKAEADERLGDALAKQKKLQEDIAISRESIRKNSAESETQSAEQLTRESEQLMAEASRVRAQARTATGAEKEKLMAQARELDEKATDKNMQASEITGYDNTFVFDTNKENIQALLAENKTSDADLEQVIKLNEEADIAFRQAIDIRVEAISLTSKAAKLGNFSNAQEKEAEALLKQQQAVEILMGKSPDFKLKSPVTSSSGVGSGPDSSGASLPQLVDAVNASLADVVNARIASYEKLFEANAAEYSSTTAEINSSGVLNTNPRYKTIYLSANGKSDKATEEKQTADNSDSPNEKLSLLTAAVQQQDEALLQLRGIAPQVVVSTNPGGNETTSTSGTGAGSATTAAAVPVSPPKAPASVINPVIVSLAGSDTTTGAVLNYLDNNSVALKNSQAGTSANNAITELKKAEDEGRAIEEEISALVNANASPETLKSQAASQRSQGEDLLARSANNKAEAALKEGDERDLLMARARENETRGQQKMLDAAGSMKLANSKQLQANAKAIEEMLGQLKLDDKDAVDELDPLITDVNGLKFQAEKLREEANQIDNPGAKLGAISNAEEKEAELLNKQKELIAALNEEYPNYKVNAPWAGTPADSAIPAGLVEKKSENLRRQHEQLTNLTNAFTLEYESTKNLVSANLTPEQQSSKRDADLLNAESKKLLVSSAREKNEGEKTKLLNMAAKAGNAAVQQLYKLIPPDAQVTTVNESPLPPPVEPRPTPPAVAASPRNTTNAATLKVEGLEVIRGNAYNSAKPIPIDAAIGEGLSFRVQIGAFKTRIPDNAFKGLSPLNGETTNSGYIRYTAGNFNRMENAAAVKNDLRGLGYNDAFVVAYFNGKRISIAEALAMLKNEGRTPDPNAPSTAGITANANIPVAAVNAVFAEKVRAGELEKTNGLLYTIQIGVYNRQVTAQQLLNLRPLFTEQLPNGLYRYTAGIYNNAAKLNTDKQHVVDLGVRDAFISAYINGKKIPVTEARNRQANDETIKLEAEDPIVFPGSPAAPTTPVQPFSNGVSGYPAPTAENGVKSTEEGICFKVQIGAYSRQLPADVAEKFSAIKSWPVENKQVNGLYIYNIGNFSSAPFAKSLKEEANRVGIADAFITVYQDGRKLSGPEASQYLSR